MFYSLRLQLVRCFLKPDSKAHAAFQHCHIQAEQQQCGVVRKGKKKFEKIVLCSFFFVLGRAFSVFFFERLRNIRKIDLFMGVSKCTYFFL
jgi:hypothetical protein